MTKKRSIAFLALAGAAALLLASPWRTATPGLKPRKGAGSVPAVFDPSGTWMGTNNYEARFVVSVTPWSPARKRVTIVADGISDMSWLGAVAETKQHGWGVKTARNTYEQTMVALGVDEAFNVVYILRARFTTVLTDPDTGEYAGTAGYYAPDQDPFGDEPPAFACIPVTGTFQRVPMASPCELPL